MLHKGKKIKSVIYAALQKAYLNRESVSAGWSCKYLKTIYNGDFIQSSGLKYSRTSYLCFVLERNFRFILGIINR